MGISIGLCGQKYFGALALEAIAGAGHRVGFVSAPPADEKGGPDRLYKAAETAGLRIIRSGALSAATMPDGIDLIVCAHSHDFVGAKTRAAARFGAIGYHPSLLPLHRGRDAIYWTIRMGDKIAGGSVYWLDDRMDGGPIAAQGWCFVRPGDTPSELWQRDLQPLGIALLLRVIGDVEAGLFVMEPQDEALATWEPSVGRAPVFRPDLPLIGDPGNGQYRVHVNRIGGQ